MVSTSFVREAEISLRLPQTQTEVDVVAPAVDVLEIAVTEERGLYRKWPAVGEQSARYPCVRLSRGSSKTIVSCLSFSGQMLRRRTQTVVTAMDVLGQLGFVEINIATVTPPEA
ncbi:MAG: hypothetical protein CM1200mP36_00990 [Gammaproteobacteria bacterium]|nr:MAG: hypothetical protein CM1200mP36_00990 [Gammaproteobacteria bacterium]